jgi:hypothetical protein
MHDAEIEGCIPDDGFELQCYTKLKPDWPTKVIFSHIARTIKDESLFFGGQI